MIGLYYVPFSFLVPWSKTQQEFEQKDDGTYFLSGYQQVLVQIGTQETCVAVAFHQLVNVVLSV